MTQDEVFEFRGVDNLVYAEVLEDSDSVYTTGDVKLLSPVANIGRTSEAANIRYYDNLAKLSVAGSDTITCEVASLNHATLAEITGHTVDETTGAIFDGIAKTTYFALGYRIRLTDGTYRYIWRFKGTFNQPEETSKTIDGSTDTSNQSVVYTGTITAHKFNTGSESTPLKGLAVDERDGKADLSTFFDAVTTPETLIAKGGSGANTGNAGEDETVG